MKRLSKKARVRRALACELPDRPPVTLWWHEFLSEWDLPRLCEVTIANYRRFDWDLVKLNPRGTYFAEAWGADFVPPSAETFPRQRKAPIRSPDQLVGITALNCTSGVLGEHLDLLQAVVARLGDEVDVIHTVFSPLGILGMLCGPPEGTPLPDDGVAAFTVGQQALKQLASSHPEDVHRALSEITETIAAFASEALHRGASGIFYAPMTWTSKRVCSEEFYSEFGRPYDLAILERVRRADLNVMHVCGNDNMLVSLLDYPVSVINWADDGEGNLTLRDVRAMAADMCLMGGVDPARLHRATAAEAAEAIRAKVNRDTRGIIVGGGCVMRPGTPLENYAAIASAFAE